MAPGGAFTGRAAPGGALTAAACGAASAFAAGVVSHVSGGGLLAAADVSDVSGVGSGAEAAGTDCDVAEAGGLIGALADAWRSRIARRWASSSTFSRSSTNWGTSGCSMALGCNRRGDCEPLGDGAVPTVKDLALQNGVYAKAA